METRVFACDSNGMVGAQAFLESWCLEPKPGIIMDEVVSNIVRCSGASRFTISLEHRGESLEMVFRDDGKAFDPTTEVAAPDVHAKLEDRRIGGLGMFMVRKMSKALSYRREGEENVLTVLI